MTFPKVPSLRVTRCVVYAAGLAFLLLVGTAYGQCSVPNPQPFGLVLNSDLSIAICLGSSVIPQPPSMVASVNQWLPERSHPIPAIISTNNNPNLIFTSTSTMYITFITEGAGYRNSLGYFVFDANQRIISRNIVFPDASNSPATLKTGQTVQIGPFAAGTRVGFFLIGNGFTNRFWATNLASMTFFTIWTMNPDGKQHIAMFTESTSGKVLIGFEDLYNLGDADYNDAVFFVTVDGSINNNQFPTTLLVTTPMNTDVRITLQLNAGPARTIVFNSLPSRGIVSQVNADGTKGAAVTSASATVTNANFHLIFTPATNTNGSPYTTFSVTETLINGQVIPVIVRIDVLSYAPYAPTPLPASISTTAGTLTVIQLTGTDANNLNLFATIATLPSQGVLYQYNAGSVGAQITAGNIAVTDPINRVFYQSNNQYITATINDGFQFRMSNNMRASGNAQISISVNLRPNSLPTSSSVTITIDQNTSGNIDITAVDTDRDPLTLIIDTIPSNGQIFPTTDGVSRGSRITNTGTTVPSRATNSWRVVAVPNTNSNGAALMTFRFTIRDYISSNTYTATVNVNFVNQPPVSSPVSITIQESSSRNSIVNSVWTVHTNCDVDNAVSTLSVTILSVPALGTLFDNNGIAISASSLPRSFANGLLVSYTPPLIGFGAPFATFNFRITDNRGGLSSTNTFTINVNDVNQAPTAIVPTSVSTNLNVAALIAVNGQDVDAGDKLTFSVTSLPSRAGSSLTMGGMPIVANTPTPLPPTGVTLTYTPAANQFFTDQITVRVSDSQLSDTKSIPITVNYVNIPPVATAQSVSVDEDTTLSITLSATDANLPTEELTYTIRTLPTRGTLSFNGQPITSAPFSLGSSRTITFLNAPYSFGNPYTSFTFTANDGRIDSAASTVTIAVNHVNHPPVSSISSNPVQTNRYTATTFSITPNDFDANNQVRVLFTLPSGFLGRLSIGGATIADGFTTSPDAVLTPISIVYTPPSAGASRDFGNSLDTFQYTVIDNRDASATAVSVPINVAFVARNPLIASDPQSITIPEQQQQVTTITTSDLDGLAITLSVTSAPTNGRLFLGNSQGQITGPALTNGQVISTSSTGSISSRVIYVAPIPASGASVSLGANTDSYILMSQNSARSTSVTVNANVFDINFAPSVSATEPSRTVLASQSAQTATFTVSGVDPDGDTLNAVITSITMSNGATATSGGNTIALNTQLTRTAPNSNTWVISVNVPALASGTVATIGVVTQDPSQARSGPLTLTLTINEVNFAPVATTTSTPDCDEDSFVDILLRGQDDNSQDAITAFITQLPSIGTITYNGGVVTTSTPLVMNSGTTTIRYTPPVLNDGRPLTSFRYLVSDGRLRSNEQTLSINVNHVNHAPTAIVPTSVSTNLNVAALIAVNGQDVDAGDQLTFSVMSLPVQPGSSLAMGGVPIVANTPTPLPPTGVTLTYTPAANQFFTDQITVRVSDGQLSDTKSIPITVNYVNIPPAATAQSVSVDEDTTLSITLSATDANLPTEPLTYTIRTLPTRGTLSFNGQPITSAPFSLGSSRTVTFLNALYSFGNPYTSFTFTANDDKIDSAASTVTIAVNHVNHSPVVSTSSSQLQATRNQSVPFVIIAQDFDTFNELDVTINPASPIRGAYLLGGTPITGASTTTYGSYQALNFVYQAPESGSGDNANYDSITVTVSDKLANPVSVTVTFDVLFSALPPIVTSIPATPQLKERDTLGIRVDGAPDEDNKVNVQLEIITLPTRGKLYYPAEPLDANLITSPKTIVPFAASVSADFLYVHMASNMMVSDGDQSDSFNIVVLGDKVNTTFPVNIAIQDKNFAPFISAQPSITIPDSQASRDVTFVVSGIDPDSDVIDAYISSHTNSTIKLQQDGVEVIIGQPLTKTSDGLWKFQVVVPALFVGLVDRIKVYTQDPSGLKSSELELVVETSYVNFAPVTTTTSIPAFDEDQSVTFTLGGQDDNKDALSAYITGFPSTGTLTDSNGNIVDSNSTAIVGGTNGQWTLTYTPPLYTFGNPLTSIRYYVRDEELQSAEQTLSIVVNHVNHPPVASAQTLVFLYENSFTDMTLTGKDIDSFDPLTVRFTSIPSSVSSLGSNFTLLSTGESVAANQVYSLPREGIKVRFTPPLYRFFNDSYTFEVSDGQYTSSLEVRLTTLDLNYAPVGYAQTLDMDEDNELTITLTGSDVDIPADTLSYQISTVPSRGSLYDGDVLVSEGHLLTGNTVKFVPPKITYGTPYTSFTYTVSDGKASSERQPIVINVHHINHQPVISTSSSSITIDRYSQGSFVVGGSDVDLVDAISFRVLIPSTLKGRIVYNETEVTDGQTFAYTTTSFTETFTYVGPVESEGVVPDHGDNYSSVSFVSFDNANSANSESTSTSVSFNIRFIYRTPTSSNSPSSINVNERNSTSIIVGGSDKDERDVTVVLKAAPTVGSLYLPNSNTALSAGDMIINGTSPSIALQYVTPQPSSIYTSSGAQSGSFTFGVSNSDKDVDTKVDISIQDVNFAPFVSAQESNIAIPDSQASRDVTFVVSGVDPDSDVIDAYISSHTNSTIKLQQDGVEVIIGQPLTKTSDGLWKFQVVVPSLFVGLVDRIKVYTQDPSGLKSSELELVVETSYVNFAPVTTTTSIPAFDEDQSVTFALGGQDDNGDTLSAYITGFPSTGTLTDSNGNIVDSNSTAIVGGTNGQWTLTYTPPLYTFGNPLTSIRYYVRDEELQSAEQTLSIVVNHVNHPPVAVLKPDIYVFETPYTADDIASLPVPNAVIKLDAVDVDLMDTLIVNITSIPSSLYGYLKVDEIQITQSGAIMPAGSSITFVPVDYVSGAVGSFSYYITDGTAKTNTTTISVHVIDINHAPQVLVESESWDVNENSTVTVTLSQTGRFADADGDDLNLILKTAASRGGISSVIKTGTKDQSVWTFTYTPSFSIYSVSYGPSYDKVEFIVGDGQKSSSESLTIDFSVLKVNFPPRAKDFKVTGNLVESVVVDFTSHVSDIHGEVLSVIVKSLPETGTLKSNGQPIDQSQLPYAVSNELIATLEYQSPEPSQIDVNFKYAAFNGFFESGDYNVNVVITGFFNNPPVASANPDSYTTPENQNVVIGLGGFDQDGDLLSAYITSLPAKGVLRQTTNGVSVGRLISLGDKVDLTDAWRVIYVPVSLAGEGAFTFSYHLNDSKAISNEQTISIEVTNVIYPPTSISVPSIVSINEGAKALIMLQGTDPNGLTLTAQLTAETSNGPLYLSDANGKILDETPIELPSEFDPYVFPPSANGRWYVVYEPPAYKSGNGFDNFFFRVVNTAGLYSVESIVLINVIAVNDAPIIDIPVNVTTPAGTAVSVKGVVVRELDFNINNSQRPYVATVKADIGVVSIPNTVGVQVTPDDFAAGAPSITITGGFSDVNTALSGLVFSPPPNVNGTTYISVTVNDGGNTGIGGAKETTAQIKVLLSANEDDGSSGGDITPAVAGGAVGAVAAIAGAFWVFKRVSAKENYSFQLPDREGDLFSSNPLYEANFEKGTAMRSNPLYEVAESS